jgi:uncharacterized repeat protein (TIGR02543 family)
MRKLLKSIACFATAALVGTGALADYGWYDDSISIGSYNGAFSGWSGSPDSPTDLGVFSDLTVSSVAFNIWSDANDRGGANMYFRVYDTNGQVGDDQDIWLGGATRIAGDHDFSISYSTPVDLAAATGLTMEEGKTYYVDIWAKSYGDSGDEWFSNGGANYHAKFTYHDPTKQSVTFDPDGGTCDPVSAVYTIGEPYGTLPTPTKDGYALIGWFDADTGERVKAKYEVPDQISRSLVAQWGTPQTVTFNAGEGASCPVSTMVFAQEGKYEDLPKPTLADHTFAGWYDAQGNRVKDYYPVTDESSRTLTASWKGLKQTVHFDAGDGSCSPDSVQCYIGEKYIGFPTPTWSGHTFVGWYDDATGTRFKNYDSPVSAASDLYLTAHWKGGRQTVNFNAGEGSCSPTSVKCYIGETYYGFPTPTWSGHTFVGWYDDDTGTRYKNYDSPVTSVSELNLTAHWKGARQTVHFDAGEGATCSPDSVKCYIGETYIGFPTPAWDGHTFTGWYAKDTGTRYKNYMKPVTDASELFLEARWKENAATASRAKAGARSIVTKTDTLTATYIGVTGTGQYNAYNDIEGNESDAEYSAQCAKNNQNAIQLRSNNNNSGIVTTTSGGKAAKVTIVWNSATTDNSRTVNIYGKNEAYSAPSELYGSSSGDTLGSLRRGDATTVDGAYVSELDIRALEDDYTFIGLRSSSGALYLDSVQIQWDVEEPDPPPAGQSVALSVNGTEVESGDEVTVNVGDTVTITATASGFSDTVTWEWAGNDGGTWTDDDDISTYTMVTSVAGTYEIYAEASYGDDEDEMASVTIKVNAPSPSVTLSPSEATVRTGDTLTITATANNFSGDVDWEWTADSGTPDGATFLVDTSAGGEFLIIAEATRGTEYAYAEANITVQAPHAITVTAGENGSASADKATAYVGETVTLTVSPASGYTTDTITVNGGAVTVTDNSFTMPDAAAAVSVTFKEKPVGFERITSLTDLVPGDYIITGVKDADNDEEYAMKAEISTTSTKYILRRDSAVTIANGAVTDPAAADIIWTLAKNGSDQWTIYNSAIGYVGYVATGNSAGAESEPNDDNRSRWTISLNSDGDGTFAVVNVKTTARNLRYNTNSGQERFACYQRSNSGLTGSGLNFYKVPMQTVTFDPDGGECDPLSARYVIGETYGTLPTPTKDGFALIGWFDADTGERVKAKYEVPDQATRSLVAYWGAPQTVTFDPGEGECSVTTMVFAYGGKYEDMPTASWTGHTFAGWYDEDGERAKNYYLVTDESTRTLYAHWKGLPQTVHFDAGEGAVCATTSVVCYIDGTYIGFPTPTKEGATFVGWYDDDTGTRYKNYMSPVAGDSDLYLTAHWKGAQQTVHFDAGDGTCSKESVKCYIGETYIGFPTPTWEGHTFVGWYDADGTRYKNYDSPVTGDSDLYLTAHWKGAQQTVHFDAGDGTCSKESVKCYIGEIYIGFPTPTWDGHTFRGWYDADGTRYKNYQSPVTTNADLYLTATWKESASALSITAFEMSPRAVPSGTRSAAPATVESTLWFGTVAGTVYEVQWAPAVNGEWTVLKRWTADEDGEMPVTVEVPAGSAGFYRLVEIED